MMKVPHGAIALAAMLPVLSGRAVAEPQFVFEKVADSLTPVPGGVGAFMSLLTPVMSGSNVVFYGYSYSGQGLYLYSGGELSAAVDQFTWYSGGYLGPDDYPFTVHGSDVIFRASWKSSSETVFRSQDGSFEDLFTKDVTPIPDRGGGSLFSVFYCLSVLGESVVFHGGRQSSPRIDGIYRYTNGVLSTVVDDNTRVPGSVGNDEFIGFRLPCAEETGVFFVGWGSYQTGIYRTTNGTVQALIDRNTPVPGGLGFFSGFSSFAADASDFAFVGNSALGDVALCKHIGGTLARIADCDTPVPGGTGTFAEFGAGNPQNDDPWGLSFSQENTFFCARGTASGWGLYADISGELVRVAAPGDTLDGYIVQSVAYIPKDAADGGSVAFAARINVEGYDVDTVYIAHLDDDSYEPPKSVHLTIERTDSLATGVWQEVRTVTDSLPASTASQFYRLQIDVQ